MFQIQKYRQLIAEKLLNKTLRNKLGKSIENSMQKLFIIFFFICEIANIFVN